MNPQPDPYIGNIFAFLFICLVTYHTIKVFYQQGSEINDLFIVGYVEESSTSNKTINNVHITNIEEKPSEKNIQLQTDCVEALRALGMKKTEASKRMKQVFQTNPSIQTVQEFLLIALRK